MSETADWDRAWQALGLAPPADLLSALNARYAESHRAYHTLQHLTECFEQLGPVAALSERLPEIQLALWFHDAVYDTRAQDNEQQSADWAREALASAGAAREVGERVHALVMATRHAAVPEGIDAQVLVDVDLSILGAETARFAEYEQQIRREYVWVPEQAYRGARVRVLKSFLERPKIYATPWFAEHREARARANLARSIRELS